MKSLARHRAVLLAVPVLVLLVARNAYAYIDPNTGSMLLQIIIGSVLGAAAAIGVFRAQAARFFRRLFGLEKNNNSTDES